MEIVHLVLFEVNLSNFTRQIYALLMEKFSPDQDEKIETNLAEDEIADFKYE